MGLEAHSRQHPRQVPRRPHGLSRCGRDAQDLRDAEAARAVQAEGQAVGLWQVHALEPRP